jgi:hypothetical protein
MKIEPVPVQGVHVGARHRSVVDQERLDALAESMASLGLLQPITVYAPDMRLLSSSPVSIAWRPRGGSGQDRCHLHEG